MARLKRKEKEILGEALGPKHGGVLYFHLLDNVVYIDDKLLRGVELEIILKLCARIKTPMDIDTDGDTFKIFKFRSGEYYDIVLSYCNKPVAW